MTTTVTVSEGGLTVTVIIGVALGAALEAGMVMYGVIPEGHMSPLAPNVTVMTPRGIEQYEEDLTVWKPEDVCEGGGPLVQGLAEGR